MLALQVPQPTECLRPIADIRDRARQTQANEDGGVTQTDRSGEGNHSLSVSTETRQALSQRDQRRGGWRKGDRGLKFRDRQGIVAACSCRPAFIEQRQYLVVPCFASHPTIITGPGTRSAERLSGGDLANPRADSRARRSLRSPSRSPLNGHIVGRTSERDY